MFLTGPPTTPDSVVVEHDVGAASESFPFLARRTSANAVPECEVGCEIHECRRETGERSRESEPDDCMPQDASAPVRLEKGAELHLGQQGRIDPHELHRRGSAGTTQP